jgi:hypothetical protein
VTLTIDTGNPLSSGTVAGVRKPEDGRWLAGVMLPVGGLFGGLLWRRRRKLGGAFALLILVGALAGLGGCGGIGQSTAKPGTYVIQVVGVGTNSNVTHYQNVTLTIVP